MRDTPFALMMFAAGFGTRMKHLTTDLPKPLVDHALELARKAGCTPIVANLHYKADLLHAHLAPLAVQTVLEMPEILETGGGLRNALGHLGDAAVVTLNTDAVWAGPNPISLLASAWDPDRMDALLMTIPPSQAIGHSGVGDFTITNDGHLKRGPGVIYGGVQIIKTDGLAEIEQTKFSLNVLWDRMLADNRLFGLQYPGNWCDVGHPEGIAQAEKMLESNHV